MGAPLLRADPGHGSNRAMEPGHEPVRPGEQASRRLHAHELLRALARGPGTAPRGTGTRRVRRARRPVPERARSRFRPKTRGRGRREDARPGRSGVAARAVPARFRRRRHGPRPSRQHDGAYPRARISAWTVRHDRSYPRNLRVRGLQCGRARRRPQPLYSVRFTADELWGPDAASGDTVYADLWESHLEAVAK